MNIYRSILVGVLVLCIKIISAQENIIHYINDSTEKNGMLIIEGQSYTSSNSINMKFANSIISSKYLDNELKNSTKMTRNIMAINESDFSIGVILPDYFFGNNDNGFKISFSSRFFRAFSFTPDIYRLVMFGNKDLAGQKALLGESRFIMMDYQKASLGYIYSFPLQSGFASLIAELSAVKGQQLIEADIYESSLFTAETGEYIDLSLNSQYFISDQGKRKFSDFAGNGYAVSLSLLIQNDKKDFSFYASASDIGAIKWKHNSSRTHIDTSLFFEGIIINNIFSDSLASYLNLSTDTLTNIYYNNTDTLSYYRYLPETFFVNISKYVFDNKVLFSGGFRYIFRTAMPLPQFHFSSKYIYNKYFKSSLVFTYGGMGNFETGLQFCYNPIDKIHISVYTPNVISFILPSKTYSQGIFIKSYYIF